MKRVLIITYYWPPSGGSGVQRWLKFVKYLREFGYEPVVYTPANPEFMDFDHSLAKEIPEGTEVIKRAIFEPYSLYKFITGKRGERLKPGFIGKTGGLSLFIRSNFFVPDPKRFWIKPSVRYLKNYISNNRIDAIVSTGPPHSVHLIAQKVSESTGVPWLADFRDPWTKMYNFKYMGHTSFVKKIHARLEHGVVASADAVVTVSGTIANELQQLRPDNKVHVITNGFDSADFDTSAGEPVTSFSIVYTGLFVKTQNPAILWEVISDMCSTNSRFANDLKIVLIGNIDSSVIEDIEKHSLSTYLTHEGYLPHHKVISCQKKAAILLLAGGEEPESRGIMTGKFFEYLAAQRPILGFGPKGGDMDIALAESGHGEMFAYDNKKGVADWLGEMYQRYLDGKLESVKGNIEKYSRKELTAAMALVLDSIVNNKEKK